jgi:hypothetical protein
MNLASLATQLATEVRVGTNSVNFGECVGLVMKYITSLGLPWFPGNAKDLLNNAPPESFQVVQNDEDNLSQLPQPGDVVVFSKVWGNGFGHTGICMSATPLSFTLLEQNNPVGSAPHLVTHPASHYDTVLGWLRPITKGDVPMPNEDDVVMVLADRGVAASDAEKKKWGSDNKFTWPDMVKDVYRQYPVPFATTPDFVKAMCRERGFEPSDKEVKKWTGWKPNDFMIDLVKQYPISSVQKTDNRLNKAKDLAQQIKEL